MSRIRPVYLTSSLSFSAMAVVLVAGFEFLGRKQVDPVVHAHRRTQAEHYELFLEDQDFLSKFPIFNPRHSGFSDAGTILNPILRWTPEVNASEAPAAPEAPKLSVPRNLAESLLRLRGDWMNQHARLEKGYKIDTSIFSRLATFDHWDLESASPVAALIESGRLVQPEKLPTPETIDLLSLAKLHLARGARDRMPLEALQQVRHLAGLLLTTENTQLILSGLSVLDSERQAVRYFVERGFLKEGEWEPVPRNITRRAARAVRGAFGYLQIWTEPAKLERIFLSETPPAGLCAAVNDGLPKILSLRPQLEAQLPFERDFRAQYAIMDRIMARAFDLCRLKYMRAMIESGRLKSEYPIQNLFRSWPYARKIYGLRISTVPFSGFEPYEDRSAPDRK